jgi:hypothetical protein
MYLYLLEAKETAEELRYSDDHDYSDDLIQTDHDTDSEIGDVSGTGENAECVVDDADSL